MAYITQEEVNKKKKAYEDHEANKPGEYKSKHQSTIDSLLEKLMNRESFSYDFNADPMYEQYKDAYVQQGNQAMMNTMANASALTGGYGNSYASAVGAQANQQHLSQLNNVIPELYGVAMDKYDMDTNKLMEQYGAATDAENRDYSKYQDALNAYNAEREYLYNQYMDALALAEQYASSRSSGGSGGGGGTDDDVVDSTTGLNREAVNNLGGIHSIDRITSLSNLLNNNGKSAAENANLLADLVNSGQISMLDASMIYGAQQQKKKKLGNSLSDITGKISQNIRKAAK